MLYALGFILLPLTFISIMVFMFKRSGRWRALKHFNYNIKAFLQNEGYLSKDKSFVEAMKIYKANQKAYEEKVITKATLDNLYKTIAYGQGTVCFDLKRCTEFDYGEIEDFALSIIVDAGYPDAKVIREEYYTVYIVL